MSELSSSVPSFEEIQAMRTKDMPSIIISPRRMPIDEVAMLRVASIEQAEQDQSAEQGEQ